MYDDVDLVGSEIVDLLDLDLAAFLGLEYCLYDDRSCLAVRNFSDRQGVLVYLLDTCADLDLAALALAAVFGTVGRTSGKEIREDLEILALKYRDGCIDKLIEVVREDF